MSPMKKPRMFIPLAVIGLVAGCAAFRIVGPFAAAAPVVESIASTLETQPVTGSGDAADDPAIWQHPTDPSQSLIIGNDKMGALETYNLDGSRVQRITTSTPFWGNVDVTGNYVMASNKGIRIYLVDPVTRLLVPAAEPSSGAVSTSGEGLCIYDPGQIGVGDGLYAYTITRAVGRVRQYSLTDADLDQKLAGVLVRDFTIGTEAEGCVANNQTADLFISEEDTDLWRYGALPGDGTNRIMVAATHANLPPDAEGVALANGYLFVSAQNVASPNQNWVNVYSASTPFEYVKSFRVVAGPASDDCDRTDGIAAFGGNLGPNFPNGIFICQDGNNGAPGTTGNQDFKFVRLETLGLPQL